MFSAANQKKEWTLVRFYQSLVRPLAIAGIAFGLVALIGYIFKLEMLYRPIVNGPATNPLTAICIIFVGCGLISATYKKSNGLSYVFALLTMLIASSRILDYFFGGSIVTVITPFQEQVLSELAVNKNNSLGFNSALMFFCLGLSVILFSCQKFISSQLAAFFTLAIPMISIMGYAYGLDQFYGKMSILTASTGVALSIAALAVTANIGAVKALLSPYIGGKIARLQTVAGYLIPAFLGYLLVKTIGSTQMDAFGLYVVVICWFIILMVSISAIFQERVDTERREGERLLLLAAMSDNLTGLANRRKFIDFGAEAIARSKRYNNPCWILMMDIDFFKKVNDNAGHSMGDKILIEVSKVMKKSVRTVDLVSRMGGEEFSVILTNTDIEGVKIVAEKIRANIENMHVEGWTDVHGPVTISIGCALNDGSISLDESLTRADHALYHAKANGRNQVSFTYE